MLVLPVCGFSQIQVESEKKSNQEKIQIKTNSEIEIDSQIKIKKETEIETGVPVEKESQIQIQKFTQAKAVEFSGQLFFGYHVPLKPSGEKYQTFFEMDRFDLSARFFLNEQTDFYFTYDGGQRRQDSINEGQKDVLTKNVYLWHSSEQKDQFIKLGQIPSLWSHYQERMMSSHFLGEFGQDLLIRYGYEKHSDLGLSFGQFFSEGGVWELSVVNGEGSEEPESGKGKDFKGLVQFFPFQYWYGSQDFYVLAYANYGEYEGVRHRLEARHRIKFHLGIRNSQLHFSLGYAHTLDPSDRVHELLADSVDLEERLDRQACGVGYSAYLDFSLYQLFNLDWFKKTHFIGQVDSWNPDTSSEKNSILSSVVGLSFEVNKYFKWSLSRGQRQYEKHHGHNTGQDVYLLRAEAKF